MTYLCKGSTCDVSTCGWSQVLACLPRTPWVVADQDLSGRRDFRGHRIFSIDPPTAKVCALCFVAGACQLRHVKIGGHVLPTHP